MIKEDSGVSNAQAWGCPHAPQEIFKETKASKLGMPPCIPFFINNYQFVFRSTIFLSLHALCAMLGVSCSLFPFLFSLALLAVHNKLEPSFPCVGEKHAPLHPRTQHRIFMFIFVVCVLYLFHSCCHF